MTRSPMTRRPLLTVLAAVLAATSAAVVAAAVPAAARSAAARSAAEPQSCARTDLRSSTPAAQGQSAGKRPVVFAHGWTGAPLTHTASAVQAQLPGKVSVFTFDYSKWSAYWASDDHIAPCLADYLNQVSAAYTAAGGDGRIIYVAHSMGGIAIRYAMDATKVIAPVTASKVPWIVTVDTPHLGSPWGGLGAAQAKEIFATAVGVDRPNPFGVDGGRCLALHDRGSPLPASCDGLPPWLPGGSSLYQIAASITVRRTLLGVHLYDIPLSSDGIVDESSERGYLTSGPGGHAPVVSSATAGTTVHSQYIDCSVTTGQLGGAINAIGGLSSSADLPLAELSDWGAMQNLQAGQHSLLTLTLDAAALFAATCSHIHVMSDPAAVTQIASDVSTVLSAAAPPTWTSSQLTITPQSLGAVRVGMTGDQAQGAAGETFDGAGDGFTYPIRPGYPHLYVGGAPGEYARGAGSPVRCVGASDPAGRQDIVTADGFHLGGSVAQLLAIYGSRARYMPAPAGGGMTDYAGYVVTEPAGDLAFVVYSGAVREIAGGPTPLSPNGCTG